jgi:LDH2 family malate/lactate/ureidoglycolate dehydrogenase
VGSLRRGFEPLRVSHSFLAIDAARFCGPAEMQSRLAHLTEMIKSTPPAAGYEEVLVAGEPECRMAVERARTGIPLPEALVDSLGARAAAMGVAPPRSQ